MGIGHLNWDQHAMKEGHVRSLIPGDKDKQDVVIRALNGARMIGVRGSNHLKIYVENNGMVTVGLTGSGRGTENIEAELRRAHRSVGQDFPRKRESLKQFQRRMLKQQSNETPPETPSE